MDIKKVGIIGAMEIEVALLKEAMQDVIVTQAAHMEFCEGLLNGMPVVVVRSGVGKVNAAICTQVLADLFHVDAVINTGVAGSLNARIDIGDLVLASDVIHHDVDATLFGYEPGEIPQLGQVSFTADEELTKLAERACREAKLSVKTWRGRVLSGDRFIESREQKENLVRTFNGTCTEMEGAAIAQTAWLNCMRFLIIRAISDKADESAEMEYPVFEEKAARISARLVLKLTQLLAQECAQAEQ